MGKWVWDAEISKGCLVMRWIGIKYGSMSVDFQQDRTENSTILSCPQRGADFREAGVDHTLLRQVFNHGNICQKALGIQLVTLALCY